MSITIRPARPEDSGHILHLLRLLAAFEGEPDGVVITEEIIRRDGFGPQRRFHVLLAEMEGGPCGLVVAYLAYSSWKGAPSLVVHDLFVEEVARGSGAGSALLDAVADLAVEHGCCRMDVNVLEWNDKARRFYGERGFTPLEGWRIHRRAL